MRKITQEAVNAFANNKAFKKQNMEVRVENKPAQTCLKLHGNTIAKKVDGALFITNAGWLSNTTKERLNALPNVSIYQKKLCLVFERQRMGWRLDRS